MKNFIFLLLILIISSCVSKSIEEAKAETLVKNYLDSLEHNKKGYKIIGFEDLRATYTMVEDAPNYDKYKNNQLKLDSIKRGFSPKIRSWVIFVKFSGRDLEGNFGEHIFLFAIDKDMLKCSSPFQADNMPW